MCLLMAATIYSPETATVIRTAVRHGLSPVANDDGGPWQSVSAIQWSAAYLWVIIRGLPEMVYSPQTRQETMESR